jgi:hypothetical protein
LVGRELRKLEGHAPGTDIDKLAPIIPIEKNERKLTKLFTGTNTAIAGVGSSVMSDRGG